MKKMYCDRNLVSSSSCLDYRNLCKCQRTLNMLLRTFIQIKLTVDLNLVSDYFIYIC